MMKKLDFGAGRKKDTPQSFLEKLETEDLSKTAYSVSGKNLYELDQGLLPQPVFPESFSNNKDTTPVSTLTDKFRQCTTLLQDISFELEKEVSEVPSGVISPPGTISPTLKQASPTMEEIQEDLKFKEAISKVQQLLNTRSAQKEKERLEVAQHLNCGCSTGGGWSSDDDVEEETSLSISAMVTADGEKEKCSRCGGIKTLKRKPKIQTKKRSHKKKSQRKTPGSNKEMKKNIVAMNFDEQDNLLPFIPLPDFSNLENYEMNKKTETKPQQTTVKTSITTDQKPFDVLFRRRNPSFQVDKEEDKEKNSRFLNGIPLGYPEQGLALLEGADEIVIPTCAVSVSYQFPLSGVFWFKYNKIVKKGWTRRELVEVMSESYHSMYEEEDQTSEIPAGPGEGGMSRSQTNGTYGIWGHNVSDLVLHKMQVTIKPDPTNGERAFVDIVVDAC